MKRTKNLVFLTIIVLSLLVVVRAGDDYQKKTKKPVKKKSSIEAPFPKTVPKVFSTEGATASDKVTVKLFFPKLETQNPSTASPKPPNWYYYWKDGNVCGITNNVHYDNDNSFGYYIPGEDHVHVCIDAPTKNTGPETYTNDEGNSITITGQGIGPQCVAETIVHEFLHKQIYDDWHALIVQAEDDGENNGDDYDDPDDDEIPNIKEASFMGITTKKDDPDTYNMGGGYSGYGDNEIRCRKKELNPGITVDTSKDWAHPGTNSDPPYNP